MTAWVHCPLRKRISYQNVTIRSLFSSRLLINLGLCTGIPRFLGRKNVSLPSKNSRQEHKIDGPTASTERSLEILSQRSGWSRSSGSSLLQPSFSYQLSSSQIASHYLVHGLSKQPFTKRAPFLPTKQFHNVSKRLVSFLSAKVLSKATSYHTIVFFPLLCRRKKHFS